jgi:hypothetical protein
MGTCRDFPNFDPRIIKIPACKSTTSFCRANASAGRNPVTASRPMMVSRFSHLLLLRPLISLLLNSREACGLKDAGDNLLPVVVMSSAS